MQKSGARVASLGKDGWRFRSRFPERGAIRAPARQPSWCSCPVVLAARPDTSSIPPCLTPRAAMSRSAASRSSYPTFAAGTGFLGKVTGLWLDLRAATYMKEVVMWDILATRRAEHKVVVVRAGHRENARSRRDMGCAGTAFVHVCDRFTKA